MPSPYTVVSTFDPSALTADGIYDASTSTSKIKPASTPSSKSTHILANSMSLPLNSNSNTLNNDVSNESSRNLYECQTEVSNKSVTLKIIMIASNEFKMAFPLKLKIKSNADALRFPLKTNFTNSKFSSSLKPMPRDIDEFKENFKKSTSTTLILYPMVTMLTKSPIFKENEENSKQNEFPQKQIQHFPTSVNDKPEILKFQILPFSNDLNMPQAKLAANSAPKTHTTTTKTTTIVTTSPKIITQSNDLADLVANTIVNHAKNNEEEQEKQQNWTQTQVHYDNQECANDNYGDVIMPENLKQPKAKKIFKNENSEKIFNNDNEEHNKINTHNNDDYDDDEDGIGDGDGMTTNAKTSHKHELLKETAIINGGKTNSIIAAIMLNYDEKNVCYNFNIQPKLEDDDFDDDDDCIQRFPFVHQQYYSDVYDTSSKEVLADIACGQCGTLANVHTATALENSQKATLLLPSTKSSFSPICELTSHTDEFAAAPAKTTAITLYDKLPNFELLPNYYALELVDSNEGNWTETILDIWHNSIVDNRFIENSNIQFDAKKSYKQKNFVKSFEKNVNEQKSNNECVICLFTYDEMTLKKLEEQQDGVIHLNSSKTPSPVPSLIGIGKQDHTNLTPFHEMKFEMSAIKNAKSNTLPERYKQERFNKLPSSPSSSASSNVKRDNHYNNVESLAPSSNNLIGSESSKLFTYPENTRNSSYSTRLAAKSASELVKPENEVNRSVSIDTLETVLPTRTRLRRQRRMASQNSTDKNEDPIERLNKLRARISGALSEVKGVLNKYSTETEPNEQTAIKEQIVTKGKTAPKEQLVSKEQLVPYEKLTTREQTPFATKPERTTSDDNGPVQFRFVRKIRRRSIFSDDKADDCNEYDEQKETQLEKFEEKKFADELLKTGTSKTIEVKLSQVDKTTASEKEATKISQSNRWQTETKTKNLPKIEIVAPESPTFNKVSSSKDVTSKKMEKEKLAVKSKYAHRRASTGAIREADSKLTLEDFKTQRRPSDSAAIIKGQSINIATISINEGKPTKDSKKSTLPKVIDSTKPTLAYNIKTKDITPKNRSTLQRSDSQRRASIAAVEKSKIELSVKDISKQRRPSDSTAIMPKEKAKTATNMPTIAKPSLITRRPTPRVKAGIKVKRPASKLNENDNDDNDNDDDDVFSSSNELLSIQSIKATNDATPKISSSTSTLLASLPAVIDNTRTTTVNSIVDTVNYSPNFLTDGQSVPRTAKPTSLLQTNEANSQIAPLVRHANDNTATLVERSQVTARSLPTKGFTELQQGEKKFSNNNNNIKTTVNDIKYSKEALQKLNEKSSIILTGVHSATKIEDDTNKKRIHQQEKIQPLSPLQQEQCAQQVVDALGVALDSVPENSNARITTKNKQSTSSEVIASFLTNDATAAVTTKTAVESNSGAQAITTACVASTEDAIKQANEVNTSNTECQQKDKMPELQISPTPVKAVQIHAEQRKIAPFNLPKEELPQKRIIFNKLLRQKSLEKPTTPSCNKKPTNDIHNANSISTSLTASSATKIAVENKAEFEVEAEDEVTKVEHTTDEFVAEPGSEIPLIAAIPKKPRKVKKKVIIKRQQRRLSSSDQTFFNNNIDNDQQDEKASPNFETLEKAIAYVTDDEDEIEEKEPQPMLPLKGCMRQREFQVGDLVMYAERYKRTQVRWKKGYVLERITSISYKLDVDGKEVPAHISYIKRYTDRKVSFGSKEYLEIDYEQIAEAEEKPRRYSIWNMV